MSNVNYINVLTYKGNQKYLIVFLWRLSRYIFHFIDQSVNDLYLDIHRKWVEAHGTNESNSAGLCMEEVVVSIHPESLQFWQDPVSLKWLEIPGVKSVHFELDLAICNGSQLLVLSLIPELDCWKKEDLFPPWANVILK